MANHSLLFRMFHKYLIIQTTCTAPYLNLQCEYPSLLHPTTPSEEPSQINVILQQKLPAAKLSAWRPLFATVA